MYKITMSLNGIKTAEAAAAVAAVISAKDG